MTCFGKNMRCLLRQCCGCRWPGNARSQGVSSHGFDFVLEYSSFSTTMQHHMIFHGKKEIHILGWWHRNYRQISNIRYTKYQNLNVSRLALQLYLPNPLNWGVNSLWPRDAIWRQTSGSYWLRQWLVAWRHQAITWTNVDWSSVKSSDIHIRSIS